MLGHESNFSAGEVTAMPIKLTPSFVRSFTHSHTLPHQVQLVRIDFLNTQKIEELDTALNSGQVQGYGEDDVNPLTIATEDLEVRNKSSQIEC